MSMIIARKNEAAILTEEMSSKVFERMNKNLTLADKYERLYSQDGLYEVSRGTKVLVVDLPNMKCNCKEWQIRLYPCPHTLKCLDLDMGESALSLLHSKLKTPVYVARCAIVIRPIPHSSHWNDVDAQSLLPLLVKKKKN